MQGSHRTFPTTPREPRWYASAGQLLIRGQVASWARFPLRGCAAKSEDVPWMEGATLCSWRAVGRGQCAANIPQCTGHPRQRHILPKKAGVPGRELLLHAGISPAAPCCLSRGPPQAGSDSASSCIARCGEASGCAARQPSVRHLQAANKDMASGRQRQEQKSVFI